MSAPQLVIDIETKADRQFLERNDVDAVLRANIKAPENYKSEEAISRYCEEKYLKMIEKAALDPWAGRVVAIGCAPLHSAQQPKVWSDETDERSVLSAFSQHLEELGDATICGWHVRDFDVPFLIVRSSLWGVALPKWFPHPKDYRRLYDLGDMLPMQLDQWLMRFNLPLKENDSKSVAGMNQEQVAEHCAGDVIRERALLLKFARAIPQLRLGYMESREDLARAAQE